MRHARRSILQALAALVAVILAPLTWFRSSQAAAALPAPPSDPHARTDELIQKLKDKPRQERVVALGRMITGSEPKVIWTQTKPALGGVLMLTLEVNYGPEHVSRICGSYPFDASPSARKATEDMLLHMVELDMFFEYTGHARPDCLRAVA